MILFTVFVIASAVVVCLALAASSSPVYGFNSKTELAATSAGTEKERLTLEPKDYGTVHPDVGPDSQPVILAAGMQ